MIRTVLYVAIGVIVGFALIYTLHRLYNRPTQPLDEIVVRVDTLIYRDIAPDSISAPQLQDSLPIYHFSDSVDGAWSAEVAGRDVELRSLVLRESYESRRSTLYAPPTWEVMARVGITPASGWVGVGVERSVGRMKLSLGAGYDPFEQTPYVEGSIGFTLWREY
ncbi:MAG: hypothetical protein SNH55_03825 [Rikenellaceae bacterium]